MTRSRAVHALVVNCCGLGDGFIEIPFLERLERTIPRLVWYHTEGRLFHNLQFVSALGFRAFAGTVPARWRKFDSADWTTILEFMERHQITLVVNLRHMGPRFDVGYYAFRAHVGDRANFWALDFDVAFPSHQNIRQRMSALFDAAGFSENYPPRASRRTWAGERRPAYRRIGINIHAGNSLKQWPIEKWRTLGTALAVRGYRLAVLDGHTDGERHASHTLAEALNRHSERSASIVPTADIRETLCHLAGIDCVVSTDSWPVHAATSIGVRTVGLYIVTSSTLWGGVRAFSWPMESDHLRKCEKFDDTLGICRNQYVPCPLVAAHGDGITVAAVLDHVIEVLSSSHSRRRRPQSPSV